MCCQARFMNNIHPRSTKKNERGFTFAELLAAMLFTALVIPIALEGIHLANRTSVYSERKITATRLAENKLNELVATQTWNQSTQQGQFENFAAYRWELITEPWAMDDMTQLTIIVYFPVQSSEFHIQVSTLIDESAGSQGQ